MNVDDLPIFFPPPPKINGLGSRTLRLVIWVTASWYNWVCEDSLSNQEKFHHVLLEKLHIATSELIWKEFRTRINGGPQTRFTGKGREVVNDIPRGISFWSVHPLGNSWGRRRCPRGHSKKWVGCSRTRLRNKGPTEDADLQTRELSVVLELTKPLNLNSYYSSRSRVF